MWISQQRFGSTDPTFYFFKMINNLQKRKILIERVANIMTDDLNSIYEKLTGNYRSAQDIVDEIEEDDRRKYGR